MSVSVQEVVRVMLPWTRSSRIASSYYEDFWCKIAWRVLWVMIREGAYPVLASYPTLP